MLFPKEKPIRLHGSALCELNQAIHERDGHSCIICHHWVGEGEKFHHYPFGNGSKSDEISKGVTLCLSCHGKAHGAERAAYAKQCAAYIAELYDAVNDFENGKKVGSSRMPKSLRKACGPNFA